MAVEASTVGRTALVLSGGNALGAFHGGACDAFLKAGMRLDWIVGSSTGAINGALIAGNPPERRRDALHRFWSAASVSTAEWSGDRTLWGTLAGRWSGQAHAFLFGRPTVFLPNLPGMLAAWADPTQATGLYDLGPLAKTLRELIDFDLLNDGKPRLTVVAVDLETGDEVLFDTSRDRIGPEHIMASSALLPDFQPIEIDGRLLGDGGLLANLPVEVVLREETAEPLLCLAVDLLSEHGPRPTSLATALDRRQEILLSSQGRQALAAHRREHALRRRLGALAELLPEGLRDRPEVQAALEEARRQEATVVRIVCPTEGDTVGIRTYDFSEHAVAHRWEAGARAAQEALDRLGIQSESGPVSPSRRPAPGTG